VRLQDDELSIPEDPGITDGEEPTVPEPRFERQEAPTPLRRGTRDRKKPTRMQAERFGEWASYVKSRYTRKVRVATHDSAFVQGLKWTEFVNGLWQGARGTYSAIFNAMDRDRELGMVESWHPLALATKMDSASAADNPSWEQAMCGPDREGYMRAAEIEIDTLREKDTWEEVNREEWMNVLPSTWAFKCKRFPDGTVRKYKGRFCVRGDRLIKGVDFFETFAPVVNWTMVRLLLIMLIVLGLATSQANYTAAFVQSPIDKDPNWDNMTEQERK